MNIELIAEWRQARHGLKDYNSRIVGLQRLDWQLRAALALDFATYVFLLAPTGSRRRM